MPWTTQTSSISTIMNMSPAIIPAQVAAFQSVRVWIGKADPSAEARLPGVGFMINSYGRGGTPHLLVE